MRIFLSGKVDELYGSWRDDLLGVRYSWEDAKTITIPKWTVRVNQDFIFGGNTIAEWPILSEAVLDTHDYTGPFRQILIDDCKDSSLGYFHGITRVGSHGQMLDTERSLILRRCLQAIDSSDIFYAYINSNDCYGLLTEVGYAVARGKFVAIVVDNHERDEDDTWFAAAMAHYTKYRQAEKERDFLRSSLLEAISKRAAWTPGNNSKLGEVAYSLSMIKKWSSDPRVRNEAERMLRKLGDG